VADEPADNQVDHPADAPTEAAGEAAVAATDPGSAHAAYDRGMFLTGATVGIGALMGAVITVPPLAMALAPAFKSGSYDVVDLGPISNFPASSAAPFITVTFERDANDTSGLDRRIAFIKNNGDGTFIAISNTCMHLGCPVQLFNGSPPSFACPCHGGQYDGNGIRTAGPPVRPLNRYETKVENGNLYLTKLVAMDEKLHAHQVKGPGQPVTGLMSYLYPDAPQ
jgi:menaquinol-cytochrome c reductase iron-sulfur subunit